VHFHGLWLEQHQISSFLVVAVADVAAVAVAAAVAATAADCHVKSVDNAPWR